MTRDDLARINARALPAWECCGTRGEHDLECEWTEADEWTPIAYAWLHNWRV